MCFILYMFSGLFINQYEYAPVSSVSHRPKILSHTNSYVEIEFHKLRMFT